jgi:hypothetical protein
MTLPELLEWVKSLGTAAGPIFALLWWLERGERKDAHGELRDIAKDSTTAIAKAESAIGQLITIFKPGNGK